MCKIIIIIKIKLTTEFNLKYLGKFVLTRTIIILSSMLVKQLTTLAQTNFFLCFFQSH